MIHFQNQRQRGSTLVLAMLLILIFMGLTVSMTFEARSQATLTGGLKLNQLYNLAGQAAINRERNVLDNFWVDPNAAENPTPCSARFSPLLQSGGAPSSRGYGVLLASGTLTMNAGVLPLSYNVYAANNPDDISAAIAGLESGDEVISGECDLDGRVVLSAEVFRAENPGRILAVQTALVAPTGSQDQLFHWDLEGETSGGSNSGADTDSNNDERPVSDGVTKFN